MILELGVVFGLWVTLGNIAFLLTFQFAAARSLVINKHLFAKIKCDIFDSRDSWDINLNFLSTVLN